MKQLRVLLSSSALLAAVATGTQAQVSITPLIGGYVPASDMNQVQGNATNLAKTREGTLSLGGNVEFGMLRASVAYASGTTIKNVDKESIGKGNVLGVAADLVVRPLPRVLVQPYVLAGAGQKFYKYTDSPTLVAGNDRDFAWHGGIGADLMLGQVGIAAELTDYLSKGADDKWNVHDAFLMVGLKFRLGQ
ncbi:MAG TPA: outer membrane beta-barrel protein [Gemmatimonadaceae bacterium]